MKNILIFNDISGLGNCSMSANLPVFTRLGHYCMPVPTACYSCQTGFSRFTTVANGNISQFVHDILSHCMPNAAYVGFCNDTATLNAVICATRDVLNRDAYLFVDPIMGDNGKLYPVFDSSYVDEMKRAVKGADCISPNLTEACLLADVDYSKLASRQGDESFLDVCAATFEGFLDKVGCKSAVITGINCGSRYGNIALDGKGVSFVTNERAYVNYSGTGDVFSSVLLGKLLNGSPLAEATEAAADFVGRSAKLTTRDDRRFGVDFCKLLGELQ